MTEKLLDLSGKIDNQFVDVFRIINDIANKLEVPFFVIGATARDIILNVAYAIHVERATLDLDLGVQVDSWESFSKLKSLLLAGNDFKEDREPQRIRFKSGLPIDIVPFGTIANGNNIISWPPDHEVKMSTLGFQEAIKNTISVRLDKKPELIVKFASLLGITILKIISWDERYPERKKDALDLGYIMENYVFAGHEDRLYNEETDILEMDGFELEFASARLLGRDMAKILLPETRSKIIEIIMRQTGDQNRYRLIEDLIENYSQFDDLFEKKLKMVEHFKKGLLEGQPPHGVF